MHLSIDFSRGLNSACFGGAPPVLLHSESEDGLMWLLKPNCWL